MARRWAAGAADKHVKRLDRQARSLTCRIKELESQRDRVNQLDDPVARAELNAALDAGFVEANETRAELIAAYRNLGVGVSLPVVPVG
jgi:hypothetical protein